MALALAHDLCRRACRAAGFPRRGSRAACATGSSTPPVDRPTAPPSAADSCERAQTYPTRSGNTPASTWSEQSEGAHQRVEIALRCWPTNSKRLEIIPCVYMHFITMSRNTAAGQRMRAGQSAAIASVTSSHLPAHHVELEEAPATVGPVQLDAATPGAGSAPPPARHAAAGGSTAGSTRRSGSRREFRHRSLASERAQLADAVFGDVCGRIFEGLPSKPARNRDPARQRRTRRHHDELGSGQPAELHRAGRAGAADSPPRR